MSAVILDITRGTRFSDSDIRAMLVQMEAEASGDPNFARRHASTLRRIAPTFYALVLESERQRFKPMPKVQEITVAQATIFDNWQATGGKRPSRKRQEKNARVDRYRVTVEVWTIADDVKVTKQNCAFTGTAALLDGPELKSKMVELRKPNLIRPFLSRGENDPDGADWQYYGDVLENIANGLDGKRVGPLYTKVPNRGTDYHLAHIATVNEAALLGMDSAQIEVSIRTPDGDLTFSNFVTSTSTGKPLSGNGILTSRLARNERADLKNWRTC